MEFGNATVDVEPGREVKRGELQRVNGGRRTRRGAKKERLAGKFGVVWAWIKGKRMNDAERRRSRGGRRADEKADGMGRWSECRW